MHNQETINQRLAVIEDAIAQINSGFYEVSHYYADLYTNDDVKSGDSLQDVLKNITTKCEVCAKGALFLSSVGLYNKCNLVDEDIVDYTNISNMKNEDIAFGKSDINNYFNQFKDEKLFSLVELELIECAYERTLCNADYDLISKTLNIHYFNVSTFLEKYREWGKCYEDDKERLLDILNNMLANNSYFIID